MFYISWVFDQKKTFIIELRVSYIGQQHFNPDSIYIFTQWSDKRHKQRVKILLYRQKTWEKKIFNNYIYEKKTNEFLAFQLLPAAFSKFYFIYHICVLQCCRHILLWKFGFQAPNHFNEDWIATIHGRAE